MRRVTIAVIGNGKTTRANLEALLEDVVDSVDEASLCLLYDSDTSEAQDWALQWAEDKGLKKFCYPQNSYDELIYENPVEDLRFFMLWDDSDPECQLAASQAQKAGIPLFDLTDGLIRINIENAPSIPEPIKAPEHEIVEELPEATEEEIISGEDDEEMTIEEAISETIATLASLIVQQLMHEIAEQMQGGLLSDE